MPLPPFNVAGTPGPDFFTLSWERPPDATVVGYRISYGTQSGVYATVIDAGNVNSFTISPLSFNQSTYAIVQTYDAVVPANLSVPSAEQERLFPLTVSQVLVAVPDGLAPLGGVNDLFWVNPITPNVRGQIISRAKEAKSTSG